MSEADPDSTEDHDLGAAILKGACNPEAKDLAVELGEVGLDSVLEEGILKEVPVLKTIIACHKTWQAVHDQLFLRKIAAFLVAAPRFTEEERRHFLEKELGNREKAKQVGDALVLILDKLDDFEKPRMLAKVFAAYIRGHIDYPDFRRLSAGIGAAFVEDLNVLCAESISPLLKRDDFCHLLEPAGFAWTGGGVSRMMTSVGTQTNINRLGYLFRECMLEDWGEPKANTPQG